MSDRLEMEHFAVYRGGRKFSDTSIVQIIEDNDAQINMRCAPAKSVVSVIKSYSYCASSCVSLCSSVGFEEDVAV